MNVNQLINMIFRLVVRKAVAKGIDAGIDRATRGRGDNRQKNGAGHQKQARQAKQAMKVARRVGRL